MNCQTKLRINHLTAVKSVAILESNANLNFDTWKKNTLFKECPRRAKEKKKFLQRAHHTVSLMVWCGVSYEEVSQIIYIYNFCQKGVRTPAKGYQYSILEPIVNPLNLNLFQEDSGPAHKVKTTQL
ncbi:hypothetical protein TNCV_4456331 [Trichonephila clavipes]|nr:hypothetical protein TNCV_4456331 [Trichonephila clavipes]